MKKLIFILAISFLAISCHANERIEELEKENRQIDRGIKKCQRDIQGLTQRKVENFGAIKEIRRMKKIAKEEKKKAKEEAEKKAKEEKEKADGADKKKKVSEKNSDKKEK